MVAAPLPAERWEVGPAGGGRRRVALLHGFTQSGRAWAPVAAALGAPGAARAGGSGLELVAPDLPGHGRSAGVRADLWQGADLVAATLGGPAVVVGYSMGGRLALHLALRHPEAVSGLVLVSTTAGLDDPGERAARRDSDGVLADRVVAEGLDAFVRWWLTLPLFATLPPGAAAVDTRLGGSAEGLASSLRLAGAGAQDALWGRLDEVAAPTLVVTGSLDAPYTARGHRLAAAIAGAEHRQVAGAGHSVPLERPAAFAGVLAAWLAGPGGAHSANPRVSSAP